MSTGVKAASAESAQPKSRDEMSWHERRAAKAEREREARENPPNASHPALALMQCIRLVDRVGEDGAQREMARLRPIAMQAVDAAAKRADKRRRASRPAGSTAA